MKDWKVWAPNNPILRKMREEVRDKGRTVILSMLEGDPKASLLDLGCSVGDFTTEMARRIGTSVVFGVDKVSYANSKILTHAADLNEGIPFSSEEFDVVVASQLIEHLQKPQVVLREAYRVLKPTGYAIISTPNLASWHNILCLVLGRQPPGLSTQWDHRFLLTLEGLLEFLGCHGFRIEEVVGVGFYPLPRFLSSVACSLDRKHSVDIIVKVRRC